MRNQKWDFRWVGAYSITICTENNRYYSGKIENASVVLNKLGETVQKLWMEIPKQFPYSKVDTFIKMPNNLHGILKIIVET
jgi:putative transposase